MAIEHTKNCAQQTTIVLGIPVERLDMDTAIERIFGFIEAYRQDRRPRLVATVNVDFTVKTQGWLGDVRQPELLRVLREADMVTADGMPIVWYARLLGCQLPDRVTGADLVPTLSSAAARNGYSIYLLGGAPEVNKKARDLLEKRNPKLKIAGFDSPFVHVTGPPDEETEAEDIMICDRINAAQPDILFIAFGNPKQELWFDRNRHRLNVPVTLGIGGSFNFLTGTVPRAPKWMQRLGLEWIHRLASEPRRLFVRYLQGLTQFSWMSFLPLASGLFDRLRHRVSGAKSTDSVVERSGSGAHRVSTVRHGNYLDDTSLQLADEEITYLERVAEGGGLVLDFSNVRGADGPGLGRLLRILQRARKSNCPVSCIGVSSALARRLRWHRLTDLLFI